MAIVGTSGNKRSIGSKVFDGFNYTFIFIFAILTVLPFIYIVAGSFATEKELIERPFFLIPRVFSLEAYRYILKSDTIFRSIKNSTIITVMGTFINLLFTITLAYPLSKRNLPGRNFFLNMIIVTMLFSGGMIPGFLVVKSLGMLNTYWALTVPGAISAFNMIIVKNFMQELPLELEEAARIDGCSDMMTLIKIILPLSLPVMASIGLFYAVGHWNSFFNSLIYINDNTKWPLQVVLRQMVLLSQGVIGDTAIDYEMVKPPDQAIKMAVIVVATFPILCVYPFLQKYFAKGVMVGAVKG
jgi:putative aldouronate transport system permease protein